ncbi:hypothetical protein OG453_37910 [Streptomyces sp. NBC_01381]|uniref:hypothetical protein n=1 Tax=Streptomyces sp. NBC_01381 TaxID=2903845 RepID=UPI00224F77B8|nr:hypothetical protein [Streptomyces sp. NBC_01381]MCX4672373.1 hypothetical protein [Streptomyces sp. NBC_01381]
MGTTLTPDFWRLFAVLLVSAMAVTFVVSAALDALVLRLQRRRTRHLTPITHEAGASDRPHRALVHH